MDNQDIKFECYRKLKKNLGFYDSLVECFELALCFFIDKGIDTDNLEESIKNLSQQYNIRVDKINCNELRLRAAYFYIASVHQQAEEFFREIKKEHPKSYEWNDKIEGSLFIKTYTNIARNLNISTNTIPIHSKDIFEYYNLIRNKFMHQNIDNKILIAKFASIKEKENLIKSEYNVNNAPNQYDNINFNDFVLFSMVTKDIALKICQMSMPDVEYFSNITLKTIGIKLKRLRNNPSRLGNAVKGYLLTHFSLKLASYDAIINDIIIKIK